MPPSHYLIMSSGLTALNLNRSSIFSVFHIICSFTALSLDLNKQLLLRCWWQADLSTGTESLSKIL